MKVYHKVIVLATIISILFGTAAALASRSLPDIYVNNDKLDIYASITSLGATLVPMRPIFEKYGMTVNWDNSSKTVTATKGDTTIKLTHNSYDAYLNGEKVTLNQVPTLEPTSNIFYVNLRFISEALGATVTWTKTEKDASIYIEFAE